MVCEWRTGEASTANSGPDDNGFRVEYYFFYGTLMDHSTLAKVLDDPGWPELYPAQIVGWSCKLWGDYPALLVGPSGNVIHGMVYEVKSPKEQDRLIRYETSAYQIQKCFIEFEDGTSVVGKTFTWNADMQLLREGTFDLKDWLLKQKEFSI
jgi:gamma-glutamylcyclotransferase (GGCT)/AIG2-like uncharacterized protein YtfP